MKCSEFHRDAGGGGGVLGGSSWSAVYMGPYRHTQSGVFFLKEL